VGFDHDVRSGGDAGGAEQYLGHLLVHARGTGQHAAADVGHGLYVNAGATFTMGGGTISGNTATTKGTAAGSKAMGGGVCVSGDGGVSKFIMEGNSPSISDNEVKKAGSGTGLLTIGGGVCVCDGATFEMKAGSIKNNKALEGDKRYFGHTGGGVCVCALACVEGCGGFVGVVGGG